MFKCLTDKSKKEPEIKPVITKSADTIADKRSDILAKYRHIIGDPEIDSVLIVIGHTAKSWGCATYMREHEYKFCMDIAGQISRIIHEKRPDIAFIFETRDIGGLVGAFSRGNKFKPDITIELHLNAATNPAYGTETLALKGDLISCQVGHALSDYVADQFGFKKRRYFTDPVHGRLPGVLEVDYYKKGFIKKRDRGTFNLEVARDYTTAPIRLLIEPTFVNHETSESKALLSLEGRQKYAQVLADFLMAL